MEVIKLYPIKTSKWGGNRKPQTYKYCECCKSLFGPLDRLNKKYCSYKCKSKMQKGKIGIRRKINHPLMNIARNEIYKAIRKRKIEKPQACSICGKAGKRIIAHHYLGYERINHLNVKWICDKCHSNIHWEDYTGKKAVLTPVQGR